jgi:hypothetical protein
MFTGLAVIIDNLGISHAVTSYDGTGLILLIVFPINESQASNSRKLLCIVCNKHGIISTSGRGNQYIIRPDWYTLFYQIGSNQSRFFGTTIIKWQAE